MQQQVYKANLRGGISEETKKRRNGRQLRRDEELSKNTDVHEATRRAFAKRLKAAGANTGREVVSKRRALRLKERERISYKKSTGVIRRNVKPSDTYIRIKYDYGQKDWGDVKISTLGGRRARRSNVLEVVNSIQFTLVWMTKDDLDLHCITPDDKFGQEHIWHSNRTSTCGGELDVDANGEAASLTLRPVENIFWTRDPPQGHFQVYVENFSYNQTREGDPVPFTLSLKFFGQEHIFFERECKGTGKDSHVVFEFDYVPIGKCGHCSGKGRNIYASSLLKLKLGQLGTAQVGKAWDSWDIQNQ